ncbi:MAG: hypothetical protein IJ419_15360 [Agathobacter sp.]|nr:hypothetical protein [Agathobacter sp.]
MKPEFTLREKVLMCILAVLVIFCIYYFAFLVPATEQMNDYVNSNYEVEDQIIFAEAKAAKMKQMEAELKAILNGEAGDVKELPEYDNSQNVMNSLSVILMSADQYNISFSNVSEEESTIRRNVVLEYDCSDYDTAKSILTAIHDGPYRCLLKDFHLSKSGKDENEGYHIVVDITYFEYK